jgi:phosphohistidine phosphatase SixA
LSESDSGCRVLGFDYRRGHDRRESRRRAESTGWAGKEAQVQIIFMRHGERAGSVLTERGQHMAERAGRWLIGKDYLATHVLYTKKAWTLATADLVLNGRVANALPSRNTPTNPAELRGLLDGVASQVPADAVVMMVGHGKAQELVQKQLASHVFVPDGNRCATFVLDRTAEGGWTCVDHWPGMGPGDFSFPDVIRAP